MHWRWHMRSWLAIAIIAAACEGPPGPPGQPADPADPADPGDPGDPGGPGRDSYLTSPGLDLTLDSATVDADGTARVRFTLDDGEGVALDREGLFSEGAVALSFTLAWLDTDATGEAAQYTAYVTRAQTSPITMQTATQAATESNGTFRELGMGEYEYTFATKIAVADVTATHTVGAYATRTVDGARATDDATLDFVPDGSAVTVRREVATEASCNNCHDPMSAHGGARQKMALCVLCHTPQTVDPDTGNTVDMKIMIHKIHRGESLPSVEAGTPYRIIGFNQTPHDYSHVVYPQAIERCDTCHDGAAGDNWKRKVATDTCLSCHDDIAFQLPVPEGKVLHGGGDQPANVRCNVCHPASGPVAGVEDSHFGFLAGTDLPSNPFPVVTLLSITDTAEGQRPIVDFKVEVAGAPRNIQTAPLSNLRFTIAGPNTDYAKWWQVRAQGGTTVGEITPVDAGAGIFRYRFPDDPAVKMPAGAAGSYTVGVEAMTTVAGRAHPGPSPTMAFAVGGGTAEPRRKVVDNALCNSCHLEISFHGSRGRRGVDYCLMCHGPTETNDERVPHPETGEVHVNSVDFRMMIHRIHRGTELSQPYVLGGNPPPSADNPQGVQHDFRTLEYPGRQGNCATCHIGETYMVPLPAGRLPSRDEVRECTTVSGDGYCPPAEFAVKRTILHQPEAAACTGCHDDPATSAHVSLMTTADGRESCGACHGAGSLYDVKRMHGLP